VCFTTSNICGGGQYDFYHVAGFDACQKLYVVKQARTEFIDFHVPPVEPIEIKKCCVNYVYVYWSRKQLLYALPVRLIMKQNTPRHRKICFTDMEYVATCKANKSDKVCRA